MLLLLLITSFVHLFTSFIHLFTIFVHLFTNFVLCFISNDNVYLYDIPTIVLNISVSI
jgi:hypothetical protein